MLGVGVGGEDHGEVLNAGVDPATRGRRFDETIDHQGHFFSLRKASILSVPDPPVPLVVGGSGDVAVWRTATYGDGCTASSAQRAGMPRPASESGPPPLGPGVRRLPGSTSTCGAASGGDADRARDRLEGLYNLPAEEFEHVTAAGTPEWSPRSWRRTSRRVPST